jgi:hypothetical protein
LLLLQIEPGIPHHPAHSLGSIPTMVYANCHFDQCGQVFQPLP